MCIVGWVAMRANILQGIVSNQREMLQHEVLLVHRELAEIEHYFGSSSGRTSGGSGSYVGDSSQRTSKKVRGDEVGGNRRNFLHTAMSDEALEAHRVMLVRAEKMLRHANTTIMHSEEQVDPTTILVRAAW
jgi:hypothetical protein